MTTLTHELAKSAPDVFREELINGLPRRSVYGKKLWDSIVSSGLVDANSVQINHGSWISRSNAQRGYIHLGVQPLSASERERLIFKAATIPYEQEVTLRFLHESAHLFEASRIQAGSELIQDLLRTTRVIRQSTNQRLGLSAVGSMAFYAPEMRFREDSTELMAMYALDPDYLRDFLMYVDDSGKSGALNAAGVTAIPGHGNEIYALVEDTVREGIAA